MNRRVERITILTALLMGLATVGGDSHGGPKQIFIEARLVEVSSWEFTGGKSDYPYLQFDTASGVKFKPGKKLVKDGEKFRGVQMKAKQNNAAGFFLLGQEYSVDVPIIVSGTYQLRSMKGIRPGSTIGIEFDSPFVDIGGSFDNFVFAGARYETGGFRAFTSVNGSEVGNNPFFADTMSLDVRAFFNPGTVTIDVKPSEIPDWTNLVTDQEFAQVENISVGIGMFNVDKGAKAVAGCITVEGPGIFANPAQLSLIQIVDEIRENLATAHTAMTREDGDGDPDPDVSTANQHLQLAGTGIEQLSQDFEASWNAGLLSSRTPYEDVMKRIDKANRKLVPVLGRLPLVGDLFRSSDEKRVRKTELQIFVTAKLITVGDED